MNAVSRSCTLVLPGLLDLPAQARIVRGDRHEMQQIVLNLLTNAVHAVRDLPADRPRTVRLQVRDDGAYRVLLVEDSGGGIPPDVLQKALSICGPDLQNSHVLAVVGREGDFDSGVMVITLAGVGYHIGKLGVGRFAWHDVLGAFVAYSETEVTLANHQRIDFPESSFQPMYALESLFNQVAGLE